MKKTFLHPILFAILPTLILYKLNIKEAWIDIAIVPLVYSLLFALFSWLIFWLVLRNMQATNVFTSIWLILFFSYGHLYLLFSEKGISSLFPIGTNAVLLFLYFFLLLFSLILVIKLRNKPALVIINNYLNLVALTMLFFNLASIIPLEIKRAIALNKLKKYKQQQIESIRLKNKNIESYPDIYYFIFDRYANLDILKKHFDYVFESDRFTDFLNENSFYLAEKSFANYPTTFLSLASSLNLTHLTFLEKVLGTNYSDQTVVYSEFIQKNKLAILLKDWGYKYIHFGDSWAPTQTNPLADKNYNLFTKYNEFLFYLYENTLLNTISEKLLAKRIYTGVERLNRTIENLDYRNKKFKETVKAKGPKFVFAHFLLPHPPYLFSQDCHGLSFEKVRKTPLGTGYLNQTHCANSLMQQFFSAIKKNSKRPFVVVFQSDEGPYLPEKYFPDEKYSFQYGNTPFIIHSYILNALYLSDKNNVSKTPDYEALGFKKSLTPVNTFRLILNYYFGTDFKTLQDRAYIFKNHKKPYQFTEITSKLNL